MKRKITGDKKETKTVIFIPHTRDSGLAREMKIKKLDMEKIT